MKSFLDTESVKQTQGNRNPTADKNQCGEWMSSNTMKVHWSMADPCKRVGKENGWPGKITKMCNFHNNITQYILIYGSKSPQN